MRRIIYITLALLIFCSIFIYALSQTPKNSDWLQYDYRDTRSLIRILESAKSLIEKKGLSAFSDFDKHKDKWTHKDAYLYTYKKDGTCLYNANFPQFVGKDLSNITDTTGIKILQGAFAAAANPSNHHGWYHYWWRVNNRFPPIWKSSCNTYVTTPDGEELLLGIGMSELPIERSFTKSNVDSAVTIIERDGIKGLEEIRASRTSLPKHISPVFAFTKTGEVLVSYSFTTHSSHSILHYTDDAGHKPILNAINNLEKAESTWVVFLTRSRTSMNMHKHGLYVRKVDMNGQEVYVASMLSLPKPSWMK